MIPNSETISDILLDPFPQILFPSIVSKSKMPLTLVVLVSSQDSYMDFPIIFLFDPTSPHGTDLNVWVGKSEKSN